MEMSPQPDGDVPATNCEPKMEMPQERAAQQRTGQPDGDVPTTNCEPKMEMPQERTAKQRTAKLKF